VGEGLIATSLHVIGESRPVQVQLADGTRHDAVAIHAFDRHADLAVIQIKATHSPILPLANSDKLEQGEEVVAIGNPLGLQHSVVEGVLSGRRTFDGIEMLQVALPIEPGNSGGPLLDRQGRVHGVVNMKSALTRNLGFATPANLLKALLDRPNPVPMNRWMSFGSVNTNDWKPVFGAHWRQRGNHILVDGLGTGFGGRSLLVSSLPIPERPYELAVSVKLDDESGAAGLIFGSDGGDRHYGFYPTGGQLRLTRFDGPDVFSWNILTTVPSPHYRRGDWNRLRVRVQKDRILCYVNEQLVIESQDPDLPGISAGLAKFRDTSADFQEFALGTNLSPSPQGVPESVIKGLGLAGLDARNAAADGTIPAELWLQMRTNSTLLRDWLGIQAREFEQASVRLRQLANRVHRDAIRDELVALLKRPEEELDLFHAALLIARHDNPDLQVDGYRKQLERLSQEVRTRMPGDATDRARVEILSKFLFAENGFHGSRHDYYNRANSYINEVMDDREGLPITLSVLFLELAQRTGVRHVSGVPLPGHFIVKHAPPGSDEQLIDVFNGGKFITHTEADEIGSSAQGVPVRSEFLKPATKREILTRMLVNLQTFTESKEGPAESLRYLDLLVALAGDDRATAAQRIERSRVRLMSGDRAGAREDLKWILEKEPAGIDIERVADMIRRLDR
jgi:regulator of sirC expression with transglutaminase-like and TPR domain